MVISLEYLGPVLEAMGECWWPPDPGYSTTSDYRTPLSAGAIYRRALVYVCSQQGNLELDVGVHHQARREEVLLDPLHDDAAHLFR